MPHCLWTCPVCFNANSDRTMVCKSYEYHTMRSPSFISVVHSPCGFHWKSGEQKRKMAMLLSHSELNDYQRRDTYARKGICPSGHHRTTHFFPYPVGVVVDVVAEASTGEFDYRAPLLFVVVSHGLLVGNVVTTFGSIKQNAKDVIVELHGTTTSPIQTTRTDQFGRFVLTDLVAGRHYIARVVTPPKAEMITFCSGQCGGCGPPPVCPLILFLFWH